MYQSTRKIHSFLSRNQKPLNSIGHLLDRKDDWKKNLPFFGDIDSDSAKYNTEDTPKLVIKPEVPSFIRVTPIIDKNTKKRRAQKQLRKNMKIHAKLSKLLIWLNKEATTIIPQIMEVTDDSSTSQINKVLSIITEDESINTGNKHNQSISHLIHMFSKKRGDIIEKLNIVNLQDEIISYALMFDIYSQDGQDFIKCLEEYKTIVKYYLKEASEFENGLKKLKHTLTLNKFLQNKHKTSKKDCKLVDGNTVWNALDDYFPSFIPEVVSELQNLSKVEQSDKVQPLLSMYAVNRLSAVLRALKYCTDADINFDTFQSYIRDNVAKYLKSVEASQEVMVGSFMKYPDTTDFEYLLSLKREGLIEEINRLCKMLIDGQLENCISEKEEETLKLELSKISERNRESELMIAERILNSKKISPKMKTEQILQNYSKYMKKKKEDISTFNRDSTEYTDRKDVEMVV